MMVCTKTSMQKSLQYWMSVLLICIMIQIVHRTFMWPADVNDGAIASLYILGILCVGIVLYIPNWKRVGVLIGIGIAVIISDLLVSWVYPLRYTFDVRSIGSLRVEVLFKAYDYYSVFGFAPVVMAATAVLKLVLLAVLSLCRIGVRVLSGRHDQGV